MEGFEPSLSRATTWRLRPLGDTHHSIDIIAENLCPFNEWAVTFVFPKQDVVGLKPVTRSIDAKLLVTLPK